MAKTLGANPWKFTAATDAEGLGSGGEHEHPLYVDHIEIKTGAGGAVLIEEGSGGRDIVNIAAAAASDNIWWDVHGWVKQLYVTTLPASAVVSIYLGKPGD